MLNKPIPQHNFPHKTLTKILGRPTPKAVQTLRRQVYANAKSVFATYGNGYGHLGAVVSATDFAELHGNPVWVAPTHPGPDPFHAPGATEPQIQEDNRLHRQQLENFALFSTTINLLRQQIIEAVDIVFIFTLEHDVFGFAEVSPLELLDHLNTNYGTISQRALEKNRDVLSAKVC